MFDLFWPYTEARIEYDPSPAGFYQSQWLQNGCGEMKGQEGKLSYDKALRKMAWYQCCWNGWASRNQRNLSLFMDLNENMKHTESFPENLTNNLVWLVHKTVNGLETVTTNHKMTTEITGHSF